MNVSACKQASATLAIPRGNVVMLENRQMDAIFKEVEPGTPVTIVGAIRLSNSIAIALTGLDQTDEDEEG